MKRKGFTLIELLAVILILGIIALIAIPTVNNIIKESKIGAFNSSVKNIVSTIENNCQVEKMKGQAITRQYVFSSEGVTPSIDIKGSLPTSGSIALNDDCEVVVSVSNGTNTVKKSLINDDFVIDEGNGANNNLVVPLNKKTKKNVFVLVPREFTEAEKTNFTDWVNEVDLKNFMGNVKHIGFNLYVDENDEVLDYYEITAIPNTYSKEDAINYASRMVNYFIKNEPETISYYYITDEYIYLMDAVIGFYDSMQEQIQTLYGLVLENKDNPEIIANYLEIIY